MPINEPTTEQLKEAEAQWQKRHDDAIVAKALHYEDLARRILSHDGKECFQQDDVRHLAEMLLLIDLASTIGVSRFRSRYAGNY